MQNPWYSGNLKAMLDFFEGHTSLDVFMNQFSMKDFVMCIAIITFLFMGYILKSNNEFKNKDIIKMILCGILFGLLPYFTVFWIITITLPLMLLSGDAVIGTGSIFCLLIDFLLLVVVLAVPIIISCMDTQNESIN